MGVLIVAKSGRRVVPGCGTDARWDPRIAKDTRVASAGGAMRKGETLIDKASS